jgi:hypothetical protein
MELLDRYAETQDKLQSFIIKSESSHELVVREGGRKTMHIKPNQMEEWRFDGRDPRNRKFWRKLSWGNVSRIQPNVKKNEPRPEENSDERRRVDSFLSGWSPLYGYLGEPVRIDSLLRGADSLSVRDRLKRMGGSKCYVIDGVSKQGKYSVWIDPQHGYHIAKAEIFRIGKNQDWDYGTRNPDQEGYYSLENVRFRKIEDVWVPMEATWRDRVSYFAGKYRGSSRDLKRHLKRTEVILNPDHEALRSFYPDEIPRGAEARQYRRSGLDRSGYTIEENCRVVWQPGAEFVVDEHSRVVKNDPNKHFFPIVKILDIGDCVRDFKIEPTPSTNKGKHIVLCFWDINQQESQQVLLNLRDRQQNLAEKGVAVITVELSGAKTDEVKAWGLRNKLTFGVGASYALYERLIKKKENPVLSHVVSDLNIAWGIDRLPWLVLTDKEHVVIAEGFTLEELDEKIKEATDAER